MMSVILSLYSRSVMAHIYSPKSIHPVIPWYSVASHSYHSLAIKNQKYFIPAIPSNFTTVNPASLGNWCGFNPQLLLWSFGLCFFIRFLSFHEEILYFPVSVIYLQIVCNCLFHFLYSTKQGCFIHFYMVSLQKIWISDLLILF